MSHETYMIEMKKLDRKPISDVSNHAEHHFLEASTYLCKIEEVNTYTKTTRLILRKTERSISGPTFKSQE